MPCCHSPSWPRIVLYSLSRVGNLLLTNLRDPLLPSLLGLSPCPVPSARNTPHCL